MEPDIQNISVCRVELCGLLNKNIAGLICGETFIDEERIGLMCSMVRTFSRQHNTIIMLGPIHLLKTYRRPFRMICIEPYSYDRSGPGMNDDTPAQM